MGIDARDVENARNRWVSLEAKALRIGASEDLIEKSISAKIAFLEIDRDYWKGLYLDLKRKTSVNGTRRQAKPDSFKGTRNHLKPKLSLKGLSEEEKKIAERLVSANQSQKNHRQTDQSARHGSRAADSENADRNEAVPDSDNNRSGFRYSVIERIAKPNHADKGCAA